MATQKIPTLRLSKDAQNNVLEYARGVLVARQKFTEIHNKMEAIDIAYARYVASTTDKANSTGGVDTVAADTCCGNIFAADDIVAPIVVSQVDSMVAYLAEVFISGSPIFPVVSTPKNRMYAEQLEVLIDDHSTLGGYPRQLLMMLRDGVKYNLCGLEVAWSQVDQFSVLGDFSNLQTGQKIDRTAKYFSKLKRLDMYNTVYDYNILPGDVAAEGDYAGYLEILSKTKMKRYLNKLTDAQEAYNVTAALGTLGSNSPGGATTLNYRMHPQVSEYVTSRRPNDEVNWYSYVTGSNVQGRAGDFSMANNYEKFTLYCRIMPSEFGILAPQPNQPQIWKFVIINNQVVVEAKRIISAYDYLPILFGQPLEDGLGYQTKSTAEGAIPIQKGATTLYNIRFAAARRSVSDRALYDVSVINPNDVNSPAAAPKIPIRLDTLNNKTLEGSYRSIPFDMRGTETTIQDATSLTNFSAQLSGLNGPQRGEFQKGNKSVQEWQDTIGGSDNRLRLPAVCLEHQVFVPLKAMLALNIFQFGENVEVVSQKTGEVVNIDIEALKRQVLAFRIADGYTPKAKLASTDMIMQGLQLIMQSPVLQASYGASLPAMFAHLMELGGVRGLEEYDPQYNASQQQGQPAPQVPNMAPPAPQLPGQVPGQQPQLTPEQQALLAAGQQGQAPALPNSSLPNGSSLPPTLPQ